MKKAFYSLLTIVLLCLISGVAKAGTSYTIFNPETKTLTFYWSSSEPASDIKNSTTQPYHYIGGKWEYSYTSESYADQIEHVVIDATFKNADSDYARCWFKGLQNLKSITGWNYLKTSSNHNNNFYQMFMGCANIEDLGNINALDISNSENMESMFEGCSSLRYINISAWDTKHVDNMNSMFYGCSNLEAIFVGNNWSTADIDKDKDKYMFTGCSKLKNYNAQFTDKTYAHTNTNGYLSTLSTTDQAYAYYMNNVLYFCYDNFKTSGCYEVENTGTGSNDTPGWYDKRTIIKKVVVNNSFTSVEPKSTANWFSGCTNLSEIEHLNWLHLTKATSTRAMFAQCSKLTKIVMANSYCNNIRDMSYMFSKCSSLQSVSLPQKDNSYYVEKCDAQYMFNECAQLSSAPSMRNYSFNNTSMMFNGCSSLTTINWIRTPVYTTNCANMSNMFSGCSNITTIYLKSIPDEVTNTQQMFKNCTNLEKIFIEYTPDLSNVSYSTDMFTGCTTKLTGGKGTKYTSSYTDKTYARYDEIGKKGYFSPYQATITYKEYSAYNEPKKFNVEQTIKIPEVSINGLVFQGWTCSGGHTVTTPTKTFTINHPEGAYAVTCTAHWIVDMKNNSNIKIYFKRNSATTFTYDNTNLQLGVLYDGVWLTEGTHYNINKSTVKNAGQYDITVTGIEKGGYTGSKTVTVTVKKATLTLSVDNKEKTYGATDPTLTYKLSEVFGNDVVTPSISRTSGNNVGKYTITATVAESTNYKSASATGTFTIKAKPITVTPSGTMTKTYGDADPAFTYTASGLVGNDQLSGTLKRAAGENVGTYDFDPTSLKNDNYSISFNNTKFTIKPKNITVTPDAISKTYGNPDPVITYTTDGLVNSDKLSGHLTRKSGENVGSYDIINNLSNDNYNISLASSVKFTITQKTVMAPTVVLDSKVAVFTGSEIKPTVKLLDGETEIPSSEYIVSYSDNIQKSDQAKVIITNKNGGNYVVSNVVETFEIVEQDQAYKVTYITNGHGPENKVVYAVKNATMILPPDMIAEGYSLEGMYTDADFTAGSKWDYDNDVVNSDITLYANWTINKYTIKYYVDGATTATQTDEYDFGATVTPYNNHLTGCTIVWDKEIPSVMPAQNLEIHGDNITNKHNLIYLLDGIEYSKETIAFGTTLTIKPAPSAREGHTFSGWTPSSLPSTMPDEDITVNGSYIPNKHTITFKVNDETFVVETEFNASTASLLPKKTGYKFVPSATLAATMPDENLVVEGSWQMSVYTLTYKVDGKEHQKFEMHYGDAITLIAAPTKEGYKFSGWSEAPATMPDNDLTITGKFLTNQYTITFVIDGETYKTVTMYYGDIIIAPTVATKSGYTFSGWDNVPATMPASDITIKGSYTANNATPVASITQSEDIKVWAYNRTIYIETAPDTKYTIVDLQGRVITTSTTKSTHNE
ncbi:MAG: InlB B-repeat-containing protein, partial [Bacteroidales bacterium]|nr:InlB B-repeat-containing protein [Bacteroidales bacterium]